MSGLETSDGELDRDRDRERYMDRDKDRDRTKKDNFLGNYISPPPSTNSDKQSDREI